MKYLKNYLNFLKPLLEEVEVKYSEQIYNWIVSSYNSCPDNMTPEFYRGMIPNIQYFPVADMLYDSYQIKLGQVAWYLYTTKMNDELIINILKEVATNELKFGVLKEVMSPKFYQALQDQQIVVTSVFYSEGVDENGNIRFGGFWPLEFNFSSRMFQLVIELNKSPEVKKLNKDITKTIRHELQHATQFVNSFFLNIGEGLIKQNFDNKIVLDDFMKLAFDKTIKGYKVGLGKTKTGFKQTSDFSDEKLTKHFNKLYKNDNLIIDTEEEKELAKHLRYICSDEEYKTYLSDVVENSVDSWVNSMNIDDLKFFVEQLNLYTKYSNVLDNISVKEALTDEEKVKMELRKDLSKLAKETGRTYQDCIKSFKNIKNIFEDYIKDIFNEIIENDDRIKTMCKIRKETAASLVKLIREKFEQRLLKKLEIENNKQRFINTDFEAALRKMDELLK